MKLYKSPSDKIFAYEEDGSQDHLIPENYISVTQEQANVILTASITAEENKQKAVWLLQQTDWATYDDVANPSNSPYLANQVEFMVYRSAVRWHAVYPSAGNIIWPIVPEEVWL